MQMYDLGLFPIQILYLMAPLFCILAEEAVEQADYLYSCGETEKLYQLLLQYKDR